MRESNWRLEKTAHRGDSRFVLAQYYPRDQITEDKMGGTCGMQWGGRGAYRVFVGKPEENGPQEGTCVDGIILN